MIHKCYTFSCDSHDKSHGSCIYTSKIYVSPSGVNAWEHAKADGWHYRVESSGTIHFCPACWNVMHPKRTVVPYVRKSMICLDCGGLGHFTRKSMKTIVHLTKESRKVWVCEKCSHEFITVKGQAKRVKC